VLSEIRNRGTRDDRGTRDALFVVCDGLAGLVESVNDVWPLAIVQTCVLHLLRNTFRYASKQYWYEIARELRVVYTASTEQAARERFDEFADRWAEFVPFLAYSPEIRKLLYSTNAIESVHARLRRSVRARGHFPNEQAAMKCLYLAVRSLDPTGRGQQRWSTRWMPALNAFAITFEGRIEINVN
jgi:putative transposase